MTNRGSFRPPTLDSESETGIVFHLDYLKLTLREVDGERAKEVVERGLLEPAGEDPVWVDKGPGGRWQSILRGPGPVELLIPKPSLNCPAYVCVEMKGEACTYFGDELLRGFLSHVDAWCSWRGKRADPAWDHVAFGPRFLHEVIQRGDFNSRCFDVSEGHRLILDPTGDTCYLEKSRGEEDARLRLYDKRGFPRFEFETRGDRADRLLRDLLKAECSTWSRVSLSHLRQAVDFVDRSASGRAARCPLLPWWESFLAGAKKAGRREVDPGEREEKRRLSLAKLESAFQRSARRLLAGAKAFGDDYVLDRIKTIGAKTWGPEDDAFVVELERLKLSGLCGLPGEAEECPV